MNIDSDLLKLKYVVVKNGLAYGDASVYTIVVSSSIDLSELRNAIQADCSPLLNGVTKGALKVYRATLTESESESLLDSLESGQRVNLSDSKFSLRRGFASIGSWFSEGFHQNAVHIIVDCSAVQNAKSDQIRWSIDEGDLECIVREADEILSGVHHQFQAYDSRYYRLPVYQPPRNHPHYRLVSALEIPALFRRPSLLMHNLPKNGAGGLVDVTYLAESLELGEQLGIIVGASGSGKSRTAIEFLCRQFGFYFTCATGGSEHRFGSNDMQTMVEKVKTTCQDPSMTAQNDAYAQRFATCVVLSRVYILNYLLRSEIQLSPYEWTMMQLFPSSVADIFSTVSRIFRQLSAYDAERLLARCIHDLFVNANQSRFPLVVDEAQMLLNTVHAFSSASEEASGRRPLYTLLIRHLTTFNPFFVIPCGSGLSLKAGEHFAGSHMLETTAERRLIIVAEEFQTSEEVERFLAQFNFPLHLLSRLQDQLHQLTGRCRIATTFVERWLLNDLGDAATSIAQFRKDFMEDRGDGSFYQGLYARLYKGPGRIIGDVDMFLLTRRAVASYKMYGKPFKVTDPVHLALFELCVGRLVRSDRRILEAVVSEPLVVDAAWCFFTDHGYGLNYTLELMAELNHQPTTRGKLYEEFLPSRLINLIQHRDVFSPPLPYNDWIEYKPTDSTVHMQIGSSEFELSDYLENPNSTYYLPTNQAGPDLVGLFSPRRRSNKRFVVFLQAKLTKELDDDDVAKATATTAPSQFFTIRSTGAILKGYEGHHTRALKALEAFDGYFRVLVAFPLNIQNKGGQHNDTEPFATVDSTNAHLLFEDGLRRFLSDLILGDTNWK